MLTKLSLDTLLYQEFEGRHRVERVHNSEVSYIRCLIGRTEKKFDYINRILKRFRFWSMRVCGHTLPLSLLCITMILRVRRNFFEITTFPNRRAPLGRPPPPPLLYIRGQGAPPSTSIVLLAVCGAPLHGLLLRS